MSFAAYVKFFAPELDKSIAHHATGLFLLAWLIFSVYIDDTSYEFRSI
jgi:hypothetical protein